METCIEYFIASGPENSGRTIALAVARARELALRCLVVASSHGGTARAVSEICQSADLEIVAVTISPTYGQEGWAMTDGERRGLEGLGIKVVTGIHALGDGVAEAFAGEHTPGGIIADTLRCFSQGTKVAVEVAVMALEAGLIAPGEAVVSIGGTGEGCDTALVIKPAYARRFKDLRVLEIICKPREA